MHLHHDALPNLHLPAKARDALAVLAVTAAFAPAANASQPLSSESATSGTEAPTLTTEQTYQNRSANRVVTRELEDGEPATAWMGAIISRSQDKDGVIRQHKVGFNPLVYMVPQNPDSPDFNPENSDYRFSFMTARSDGRPSVAFRPLRVNERFQPSTHFKQIVQEVIFPQKQRKDFSVYRQWDRPMRTTDDMGKTIIPRTLRDNQGHIPQIGKAIK
jgi:hypothetical protein